MKLYKELRKNTLYIEREWREVEWTDLMTQTLINFHPINLANEVVVIFITTKTTTEILITIISLKRAKIAIKEESK